MICYIDCFFVLFCLISMNLAPIQFSCSNCPGSPRTFCEHGLPIQVGRKHNELRHACVRVHRSLQPIHFPLADPDSRSRLFYLIGLLWMGSPISKGVCQFSGIRVYLEGLVAMQARVFEGDLRRGAARLLLSDDSFARRDRDTLDALKTKHPVSSRSLSFPSGLDFASPALSVTAEDVVKALSSFYGSSVGSLDGIRPTHLRELTSVSAGSLNIVAF